MVQLANHAKAEVLLIKILKLCLTLRIHTRLLTGNIDQERFRPAFSEPSLHRSSVFFQSRSPSCRNQRHVPRKTVPTNFGGDMLRVKRYGYAVFAPPGLATRSNVYKLYQPFAGGRHVTTILNTQEVDAHSSPFVAKILSALAWQLWLEVLHFNGLW